MRIAGVVLIIWIGATAFAYVTNLLLRGLQVESPFRFWIVLTLLIIISFPFFFRFVPGKAVLSGVLIRVVLAGALSVATYYVAIYTAFAIGTFIIGD